MVGAPLSFGVDPAARGDTFSYPAGILERGHEMTARDLHAQMWAQQDLEQALRPELDPIAVTRVLRRGEPAHEIVNIARDQNLDLIVMLARGGGALYRFLLGSVTAKVLHESHCPVWTGAQLEETPARERVLCSVELNAHSRHTASLDLEMAATVDATFTLVHITSSVEIYAPGADPTLIACGRRSSALRPKRSQSFRTT